ncbi:unnamed protein product [Boreogadus saida]
MSIAEILWTSGPAAPAGGAGLPPSSPSRSLGGSPEDGHGWMEKGIVLPELSCRTAAELPPPDSAPGVHPPELPDCRTAAEALAAVR